MNENGSCDKKTYQTVIEMEQKQKEDLEKSVPALNQRNVAANAHPDPPHPHPPPQSNGTTERSHGRNSACGSILVPPNISSEYCYSSTSFSPQCSVHFFTIKPARRTENN